MPSNFKALAAASGGEPTDANFKNVTLLLHGDGSNGAQNNTFIDSSTNNFTITRNGNTTQGSFSPYGNNWSNYFDGSLGYLTLNAQTALSYGTGDFTLEAWVFPTSINSGFAPVLEARSTYIAETYSFGLRVSGGVYKVELYTGTGYTGSTTISLNTWTHIAVTRSSGTLRIFVNGVLDTSWSSVTTSIDANASQQKIGILHDGSAFSFPGYISNFRVVKGTAVYTSAFTPSTTPLTAITNTSLLTCQSNRFRDGSTNNFTITRNGGVKVTNFAPFAPSSAYSTTTNGGSAYFDGSGDYLTVPDNAVFDLGSGNLAIELFAYINSYTDGNLVVLFSNYQDASNGWTIGINSATSKFYGSISGNATVLGDTNALIRGAWNHIVLCRTGSTVSLFVNGTRVATGTDTTNVTSTSNVHIGSAVGGSYNLNGYIASARVIKGSNPYDATQSTLTVPTSPLTAITNTSLLLNATNAAIFDNSMKNDLETVGNAQISTSVKKFGTGSMAFDGSGDYLVLADTPDMEFGAGNFTIEMWVRTSDTSTYSTLVSREPGVSFQSGMWTVLLNNGSSGNAGVYIADYSTSSALLSTSGVTINDNNWHHLAVVRNGSSFNFYVDGTSRASGTWSGTIADIAGGIYIGASQGFNRNFNGYIDDLRITKGVARYTANFTAPTAPFPNK